jgi:signal transduction histidine kinase
MFGHDFSDDMSSIMADAISAAVEGAELTSSLLALSRPQSRDPVLTDANEVVENFANLIRCSLGTGISVETRLEADLQKVRIDRCGLSSALLHLAMNARNAMPDGGRVTFSTGVGEMESHNVDDGQPSIPTLCIILEVVDTGCGMSADVLGRATDAFFTTKDPDKGCGLGLSVVSSFVRSSDGDLRITSAPGAGTTVALYLPAEPSGA